MKILTVAVNNEVYKLVESWIGAVEWTHINDVDSFSDKFESFSDGDFHCILTGMELGPDFLFECGQVLRNQCATTKIFAVLVNKENYMPNKILKNGHNECFLLPSESQLFKDKLQLSGAGNLAAKTFKRIKSFDIKANTTLEFDTYIYLPRNQKHIRFTRANDKVEEKKVDKLEKFREANIYIDNKQADSFYQYVASQMSSTMGGASATEREEKAVGLIKEIFSTVFDIEKEANFDSGKELLSMCQKVVANIVTDGKDSNWYNNLSHKLSGQMDDYSHAVETSTLASFFALAMGVEKIDEIAIAAFLHDLGMTDIPDFDKDNPEHLKDKEKYQLYLSHPERSLNYIKAKRMIVSEKVMKAILQHQERFDGKGFPKNLSGDRICMEAQIISIADQFQYLTAVKPNRPKMNPKKALETIFANGSISPMYTKKLASALK